MFYEAKGPGNCPFILTNSLYSLASVAPVYTKDNLDPVSGKTETRVLSSFSTDPEHSGVIKLGGIRWS